MSEGHPQTPGKGASPSARPYFIILLVYLVDVFRSTNMMLCHSSSVPVRRSQAIVDACGGAHYSENHN